MSNAISIRKLLHPCMRILVSKRRTFPLYILSPMPEVPGNKIFVMNHGTVHDAPVADEVINEHFYVLVGKQRLDLMDRIFFWINGVIYVDRKDKKSKKQAFEKMLAILNKQKNLLLYPEGTWNMTPSKPLIPLNWGVVELAKISGRPIVPLVAEYYTEGCYVKFGQPIYINEATSKKDGIEWVAEAMASLRWEIWEHSSTAMSREQLKKDFEEMIKHRLAAYPKFDLDYEISVVRGIENSPEHVWGKR